MWKLLLAVAVVPCTPVVSAPVPKELRAQTDKDRIIGTWEIVQANRDGQKLPKYDPLHTLTFRDDGTLEFGYFDGDKPQFAEWTVDPTAKPKAISWRMTPGGSTSSRTYAFADGKLVIARSGDKSPPVSVEPGAGITVIEYKRANAK